jgi:hypothetical protein
LVGNNIRQALANNLAPGRSDNVSYEEYAHEIRPVLSL